jgi:WD40 repeat protein
MIVKLQGHLDPVEAIVFSPDGKIVASASGDRTIRFWDVKQGREIHSINAGMGHHVKKLILAPALDRIAVVYSDPLGRAEIRRVDLP